VAITDAGTNGRHAVSDQDLGRLPAGSRHELKSKGQFLATAPLQPVTAATSVRVRNGRRVVTDGPFAETREQLGGYYLVEARNLDEVIDIAGRIPGARKGTVEIRPVLEIPGLPAD